MTRQISDVACIRRFAVGASELALRLIVSGVQDQRCDEAEELIRKHDRVLAIIGGSRRGPSSTYLERLLHPERHQVHGVCGVSKSVVRVCDDAQAMVDVLLKLAEWPEARRRRGGPRIVEHPLQPHDWFAWIEWPATASIGEQLQVRAQRVLAQLGPARPRSKSPRRRSERSGQATHRQLEAVGVFQQVHSFAEVARRMNIDPTTARELVRKGFHNVGLALSQQKRPKVQRLPHDRRGQPQI